MYNSYKSRSIALKNLKATHKFYIADNILVKQTTKAEHILVFKVILDYLYTFSYAFLPSNARR